MPNSKQQIIDATVALIERLNTEISDAIDEYVRNSEMPSSYILGGHIRNRLSCDTQRVRKYIRITRDSAVVAFVCTESGDVFKPATYKGPAKHARGNVFSPERGREAFTEVSGYGLIHVKYLK